MSKSIKISLAIVGSLLAVSVFIGLSYAVWSVTHVQTGENTITAGCFNVTFTENSSAINLTNAYPISDSAGAATSPYTFTLENTCSIYAEYQINLEMLNTTTLAAGFVKAKFNTATPALLSTYTSATPTLSNATNAYMLTQGGLNAGAKQTFNLRLWMDSAVTTDQGNSKKFVGKVTVVAEAAAQPSA